MYANEQLCRVKSDLEIQLDTTAKHDCLNNRSNIHNVIYSILNSELCVGTHSSSFMVLF